MSATLHAPAPVRAKGRPIHPATVAADALVEALAAVDSDADALAHLASAQQRLAQAAYERAKRLQTIVRPEILAGYDAAEQIVSAKIPLHRFRVLGGGK